MIKITTKQLTDILKGTLIGDENIEIENISTDTRKPCPQGVFFALKGENFDAHNYLSQAVEQGCIAVVVDHQCDVAITQIIVKDTRLALGQLAKWLKNQLQPKTVAMTGSAGKTTVKEMTAAILQKAAGNEDTVLLTQGNFNNDIGVPLTLLRLTEQHRFAVIELGANHLGEIAYTTEMVNPDVALVNNVANAHLEGFGSINGVAQAKGEIYEGLKPQGIALINANCHYYQNQQLVNWAETIGNRVVQSFSANLEQADFFASNVCLTETGSTFTLNTPQGNVDIQLPYLGEHNVSNAVAAAALAMNVGASLQDVQQGLAQRSQVKGRLFPIQVNENLLLIDDTYNANVDSMKSAIDVLAQQKGFRIFAVADMAELGEETKACHQEVADFASQAQLDLVVSLGQFSEVISQQSKGKHFSDKTSMADYVTEVIRQQLAKKQQVTVLAKGSRSQKMEQFIEILKDKFTC